MYPTVYNPFSSHYYRSNWIQAIETVKKKLDDENLDTDESNMEKSAFVDMFGRRGQRQHKSGRNKVVSIIITIWALLPVYKLTLLIVDV
jgi:hypothetical protein